MRFEKFADYGLLPPITEAVPDGSAEFIFLWVITACSLIGIVYALMYGRRTKSLLPLMCMIGGGLTICIEPLIDSHLQVWWPIHRQPDVFSVWGRDMPIMLLPILVWYFGVGILLRLHMLQKYGVKSPLWLVYGIEVAMAFALEPPAISLGLWHYYGEQGLRFFGYPIWWPFVGGACGCFAGTLLYKMVPYLQGWRQLIGALLVPMAVAAVYWGVGWPMFFVLNLQPPVWVVYVVSFATVGLAFSVVWMCTIATGGYEYHRRLKRTENNGVAQTT